MVMNDRNLPKRCRVLNEGRKNIYYEERSGWPTVENEYFTQKVDKKIHQNREVLHY